MRRTSGEVVLPFRLVNGLTPMATSVRTTLLTTSLQGLRTRGFEPAYFEALPTAHHEAIRTLVPGMWVPIAVGEAHYASIERLLLPMTVAADIGNEVTTRIQRSSLSHLVRMAQATGVTPWTGLLHLPTLLGRIFIGGAVEVEKLGPKEARIEIRGVSLVRYAYFRNAWRGMFHSAAKLFCNVAYFRHLPNEGGHPTSFVLRMSWA